MPDAVHPLFFGASLVALEKMSGGVRPIAVGCSLRRLIAKIAGQLVIEDMAALLSPRQLGYGVRGGLKWQFMLPGSTCKVFTDTKCWRPFGIWHLRSRPYTLVHSAYSSPSLLLWGDKTINSAEGVQYSRVTV